MSDERTLTPHTPQGNLPASLAQCQAIDRAVAPLAELARQSGWQFERIFFNKYGYDCYGRELSPRGDFHEFLGAARTAELRQTLGRVEEQVRELWPAVNRAATAEEIAVHVGLLLVCFPDSKQTEEERRAFEHLLCMDVGTAAPSLYVLQAACARLRRQHRFPRLQIADVIGALDKARAASKRTQLLIEAMPHMQDRLDGKTQPLPQRLPRRMLADEAEQNTESDDE